MFKFSDLIKEGDLFENQCGDKLKLVKINHNKPELFVYEFEDVKSKHHVWGSFEEVILRLRRIK